MNNTTYRYITIRLGAITISFRPWLVVVFGLATLFYFCLPHTLFKSPTSFVISDSQEILLGASIAADGQWRFPPGRAVPQKFISCITTFEDKRFFYHPGVDPVALGRAGWQNVSSRQVISGGSTLTMQVIRLSRKRDRSYFQKSIEAIQAIRLECGYNKNEILALYAANAPFGSNVVGLDAAAWRYFGRSPHQLSWGEMAALAVLPNAPTLVHPGRNRTILLTKRNQLLDKLFTQNIIDQETCGLAKAEPLPGNPLPLPALAPHLLNRFRKDFYSRSFKEQSTAITTTLQASLQKLVSEIVTRYHQGFKGNGINNAAALVLDVESGNTLAYVGNIYDVANPELESHVDVLTAVRSPGSTLKPLLFAAMQSDGVLLPKQLIPDVPTQIGSYTPKNFNLEFDGAVPANRALSRSLNIPAVKMLQQFKYQRFYDLLQQFGFTTIKQPADYYGLSLILGGCEITPWELAGVYSSLARSYNRQRKNKGKVLAADWHMPRYQADNGAPQLNKKSKDGTIDFVDYTSLWHMFNAMQEIMRPGEEGLWNLFNAAQRVAWKTGTSFGYRDGWAIGVTPRYCVTVWVGNTDGEGRPDLTGINTAAPIMFDIFRALPASPWFEPPTYDFAWLPVCHESGFKAGTDCARVDTMMVSMRGKNAPVCPYHRVLHLDRTGSFRVLENCEQPSAMVHPKWFVLPPGMEYYYRQKHPDYKPLPPYKPGCMATNAQQLELVYPEANAKIYVPLEITGNRGKTVFTAAHRNTNERIFWHLDNQYLGTTVRFHQMALNPLPGKHTITLVDSEGEVVTRNFEVLGKDG
ncbi:penicillin-binding protein 1C [Segetibacter sp. 3557_3]|uniref:penicillin-binding protein 1C n=1 Tax=Segetibacter sp. 3557_3 TaxID=2547429 RepID=UPI0010591F95|nr:penicillin-binding protein 1C [Segetibacter sp. 3557_3]TDH26057.1 penicillin-binding protein 1C [Segetibacter sp. 3557_3]